MRMSRDEMMMEWMTRRYGEPRRWACVEVEHEHDGMLMARAERELRDWYLRLLDEGELRYLCPVDVSKDVVACPVSDGSIEITLPAGTRRVVAVRMTGWSRDATIVEAGSGMALRQGNPYGRGKREKPVAVLEPGGTMRLYSGIEAGELVSRLLVVKDDGREFYNIDESALGLIERV